MDSENQNKLPRWISDMEEPSHFPQHEMLDKKAAWEKLHARLDGKPNNRKIYWYWLAAASLLFAIFYPLTKFKNENTSEGQVTVKSRQEKVNSPSNRTTVERVNTVKPEIENGLTLVNKGTRLVVKNDPVKPVSIKTLPLKEMDHDTNALKDDFDNSAMLPTTANPIDTLARFVTRTSVPITKKKLRVVHINEIDTESAGYATSKPEPSTTAFSFSIGNSNQHNKLGSTNIVSFRFSSK